MKEKAVSPLVIVLAIVLVVAVVGVVVYVTLPGGEGPEGPGDETFNSLAECTGTCMKDASQILDYFLDLLGAVDNPTRIPRLNKSGWDYYATATGDFEFSVDLDEDLWPETVVSGAVGGGIGTDLSNGMQLNEVARVDWTMKEELVEKGKGAFSFVKLSWDSYRMTIVDETTFNSHESCGFEVTSFGLHLHHEDFEPGAPFGCVFAGTIEFVTRRNSDTLEGMMSFDGSDIAAVSGTCLGKQYDFTINLKTFEVST